MTDHLDDRRDANRTDLPPRAMPESTREPAAPRDAAARDTERHPVDHSRGDRVADNAADRSAANPVPMHPDTERARQRELADRDMAPADGNAVGGVSGLAAGAAIGAVTGGPVGAVIGGAAGALTGVGVAQGVDAAINPGEENRYWEENYAAQPYARADRGYDYYAPAYRYGWESYARHGSRGWTEVEPTLERNWSDYRGGSRLEWHEARPATRAAWDRIHSRVQRKG